MVQITTTVKRYILNAQFNGFLRNGFTNELALYYDAEASVCPLISSINCT
jgi:hypothetical protein